MTNGYLTFLDYLELRRRVEKRLTSGNRFLLHVIIFGIGTTLIGVAGWSPYYSSFRDYFIDPAYGHLISLWSAVLLVHGLLAYWGSGARNGRRDQVIENEMRERIQADDIYLSDRPRDLFRLHGLLNNDIRKRASLIPTLLFFVVINAFAWIPWTLAGQASTSYAWMDAMVLAGPLVLAIAWNIWRRARHEVQIRKQLEQFFGYEQADDDRGYEREVRLSSDDELVTVDEYMMKRKRN